MPVTTFQSMRTFFEKNRSSLQVDQTIVAVNAYAYKHRAHAALPALLLQRGSAPSKVERGAGYELQQGLARE